MKMNSSSTEDKLPFLEEDSIRYENDIAFLNRTKKYGSCSKFIQIVKVILYLEIIFFIAGIGYVMLQNHTGYKNYNDSKSTRIGLSESYAMKFGTFDINNEIDSEYSVTRNRDKRNSELNELKREMCERNMIATRDRVNQLTQHFILGEASNPNITMLREKCRHELVGLALRIMMMELISTTNSYSPTNEEWHNFAHDIKRRMINDTNVEYHQQIEASGPPTEEIVSELRTTIETTIMGYKNCENILPFGIVSDIPDMSNVLYERENCMRMFATLKDDLRTFEAQIVPGNSSEPLIVHLRQNVEDMATLLAASVVVGQVNGFWDVTIISSTIANLTDEQWQDYIVSIQQDVMNSTDSEHRRQLEENAPPMQEIVNELRRVVNNYLNDFKKCNELKNNINGIRESVQEVLSRSKRDSDLISERTCWIDEPDTTLLQERQVRHDAVDTSVSFFITAAFAAMQTHHVLKNATAEIRQEFADLLLDLIYETDELKNHDSEWVDDIPSMRRNFTNGLYYTQYNFTSEALFEVTVKFGQTINLHFRENQQRENLDNTKKPVFGRFVYLDDKPEKPGLRRIKHILNGFIRTYFKLYDPSSLMCKPVEEVHMDPTLDPSAAADEELQLVGA